METQELTTNTQDHKWCIGSNRARTKELLTEPHWEPRGNFNKEKARPDGLHPKCRTCVSLYNKSQRESPKVEPPEYMTCRDCGEKKHHSEMADAAHKRNGKSNLCKSCNTKRSVKNQQENRERYNEHSRNWIKRNPEYNRARSQTNRAIKAQAFVEKVTNEGLLELHGSICYLGCGRDVLTLETTWHMEHVIPLSRGGEHSYANIRVSCADCNGSKRGKTIHEFIGEDWDRYAHVDPEAYNRTMLWHVQNTPEIFDFAK